MKSISCHDLIGGYIKASNICMPCPICKNQEFRCWKVCLENPRYDTEQYKAMILFSNFYRDNQGKLNCSSFSLRQRNIKQHWTIPQRMHMHMACSSCKQINKLIVGYHFNTNQLNFSWAKLKKSSYSAPAVKIIETKTKSRRAVPLGLRYKILVRDKHICQCCGAKASDGIQLHVDHIKPVSKGGTNDFENLQTLCRDCNLGKSDSY